MLYYFQGADIIVFPEYGLTGLNFYEKEENHFISLTQKIPNPRDKIILCDNSQKVSKSLTH